MNNRGMPSRRLRAFWRGRSARFGTVVVGAFVLVAILADYISPFAPDRQVAAPFHPPSTVYLLGTDSMGYDVLTRVLHGSRLSLLAGILSVSLALGVGATAGAVAGYFGGRVDTLIMRGIDVMLAFPPVLIALLVVVALKPSWPAVILAVGAINVPIFCRQVRARVLMIRHQEYVLASRAIGAGSWHLLTRTILPGLVSPIIVLATLGLGTAILEVAGLSFLGISGQPDDPEWGAMLGAAKNTLRSSIWPALAPGCAISLSVLGFNLLGDGLRDAFDPRSMR